MEDIKNIIGKKKNRVDGDKKISGRANYTADHHLENSKHGYIINATIAKGKIAKIHTETALEVEGVIEVFTHLNIKDRVKLNDDYSDPLAPPGEPFKPLHDEIIKFNHQPIAMVVADTFEIARYAAGLVTVEYIKVEQPTTELKDNLDKATDKDIQAPPPSRGKAEKKFEEAKVILEAEYHIPREYHNPMEPHATLAIWHEDDEAFIIYDKIQGVASSQGYIAGIFGLKSKKVKVLSPFVGGGFGSGLRPQYQLFFAALASKILVEPVKVSMTRQQMFSFGHRPASIQNLKLGSDKDGKLVAIKHESICETSKFESFNESISDWSGLMYECEDVELDYKLVPLDNYTPMDMRGPGGVSGMFALECAMDELAGKIGIDPLDLRLINYAEKDQNEDKPFSSKELRKCYTTAATEFGWDNRKPEPRSTKEGHQLVGHGMATGVWEAMQKPSSAKAELTSEGELIVSSATADIGTGTYTVMAQIAAESFGQKFEDVTFKLGDTDLPEAPIEGGSYTVSSVGSAVKLVCAELQKELLKVAKKSFPEEFKDNKFEDVSFYDGEIISKAGTSKSFKEVMSASDKESIFAKADAKPDKKRKKHSCYAHSCVMVEVNVDEDLGMVSVTRVVSAVAAGKIINPKTAESQILGGITWGIGMALEEEGMMDNRYGRLMNANLAEYHVAIQADVKDHKVIFVEEEDDIVNPLGAKGVGEIGLVGVAAAIANAIYNATGKIIRSLPITLDKLI
ncbi:xanthine dehydrogenase, molybdenum binding subunit apoprotein [Flavobacteriaceae bacterium MAR_2010_188]|nr:xanthine dehydrogenase, molybdenum binding subunit apoprotein [Flavobacteriaceae bacterium MAR_2010_188]